jgi:THAP4-like, heme-binding beta-barrel domain
MHDDAVGGPQGPPLHDALRPVAWLLGTWRGEGVGGYPTITSFRYGQEIVFGHAGKPMLSYRSRTWALDDDRPLAMESGFWRPQPDDGIEVVLAHASGIVEVSIGRLEGAKIELVSDVLARTASAKEVAALHRLYGMAAGKLMYAIDMAAVGQPLQPHLSAELERTPGSAPA